MDLILTIQRTILKSNQPGQILVMALLVSVIGLTIGLAITSRSISGLQQTGTFEASNRAFSAAEAGLEQALQTLKTATPIPGTPIPTVALTENQSTFSYGITPIGAAASSYQVDGVLKDDTTEVSLSGGNGGLNVYWNLPEDPTALIVTYIYPQSGSSAKTYALACGSSFSDFGGFEQIFPPPVPYSVGSGTYRCRKVFVNSDIPNSAVSVRLKVLCRTCGNANLAVEPTNGRVLPSQSYVVRSTGSAAGTQRTVEATETLPILPAIFDYVLFSTSNSYSLSK